MSEVYEEPWAFDTPPVQLSDNIWYVGNTSVGSHLIDTGDGLILVDTTYPQSAYLLFESIRIAGFDPADIRYILHTHAHYDHIGATKMLVEKYGCKTYLGKPDVEIITKRHELTWAPEYKIPFREEFHVDAELDDGDTVTLGNTTVHCILSPGHTPGNMTYLWETTWHGEPHTAVISGGFYPNTASAEYLKRYGLPKTWRTSFIDTFDKLEKLTPDFFLGAHPVFNNFFEKAAKLTADENPFINPGEWQNYIREGRKIYNDFCEKDPL